MQTYQQLHQFLQQIPMSKQPYFVAIDGYAGAGKSTLARRLLQELTLVSDKQLANQLVRVQQVTLDDFYHPLSHQQQQRLQQGKAQQAYFDAHAFCRHILQPLAAGETAYWQPIGWLENTMTGKRYLYPEGIILIEGVFAGHASILPWVDALVMVNTPEYLRSNRVLSRPQEDRQWWPHWQKTEHWFHQSNSTAAKADWLISGTIEWAGKAE